MNSFPKERLIYALTIALAIVFAFFIAFGSVAPSGDLEQFNIPRTPETHGEIATLLKQQGFVRSALAFRIMYFFLENHAPIAPGGYEISASMSTWTIAHILSGTPDMKWIVIPEGLRKEEIADLMASALSWSDTEKAEFISGDEGNPSYAEGVYFPDTYLIPTTDTPDDVIHELIDEFNDQFAPYASQALAQNEKWTTILTLASIIQREAAGASDMPLISGILWNRLESGTALDVDSTLQYARGDTPTGWWAPITADDKKIDSPFNTYTHGGLPPHPISNPGLDAISAALNPATTTCIYYIHDSNRQIHCADTLDEQEANIAKYLK